MMAAHNAPKHDFAPAWLKIPSQDNPKPPITKQPESNDKGKRHPGSSSGKYRHHSVEDDYYYPPYGHYGYYNGYGMQYGTQSSMFPSGRRDPKYPQHPGLRYGQMNGGYPGFYDPMYPPYEYYGDPYFAGYPPSRPSSKRSHFEREGRSNSKEGKDKEAEKDKNKSKESEEKPSFQEDFPSLNGDDSDKNASNATKISNGSSVWENPPHGKTGQAKYGDRSSSMYKSLVPNKGGLAKKPVKEGLKINGNFLKDSFNKGMMSPTGTSLNKESRQSPTPPMDILNTRLVTQPRNIDKKSEFLKALRKTNSSGETKSSPQKTNSDGGVDKLINGVEGLNLDKENGLLSSSLEAEQRLLREMGWDEADEDDYEITEDEKKQFQDMISKQAPQQKEAGRLLQSKTFSPKHIPSYYPEPEQLNDTLSSSDSEDDFVH